MSRSSAECSGPYGWAPVSRGQVEPLAALAAVFAVTAALGLYTGALQAAIPEPTGADLAPTALDAVAEAVSDRTGVVDPTRLSAAPGAGPEGRRLNATLTAADRRWCAGPPIPAAASDRAARRIAVDTAVSRTTVGRLRVVVW
ncbi:DUF7285 family protein [Haloglomus salinum]|jgi:hypothetical protein|uniref:DUF7285 family protein n=1 Tax=Haloglomus salinum TaxID=2962673 RepID=UPI0020C9837F|nr:hypothetical protein [Haloglomus salinum]